MGERRSGDGVAPANPAERKPGRGIRIRTYASGRTAYEVQFRYRGITCREVLKGIPVSLANDRVASNKLGAIHDAITRQAFNYREHFPDSKRARLFGAVLSTQTLEAAASAWLADAKRAYPHSTYRHYAQALDGWIVPALGSLRLGDITPEHLRELIRTRDVTLKTIRNDLTPLRAVFDQAVDDGELERSPLDVIKVKRLVDRGRRSDYEVDPYSREEINTLLALCRERRPAWAPYWQFAFFSGLRTSELFAATWSNYARAGGTLRITAAVVERELKEPKTRSSVREVVLLDRAVEALREQAALTSTWSERIFVNPRRQSPLRDYEETQRCLKWLCRIAGVRYRNQYQTRHTFASQLLSDGENPYRVAELLGHASVEMVMRVYGKWIEAGNSKTRREFISDYGRQSASPAEAASE